MWSLRLRPNVGGCEQPEQLCNGLLLGRTIPIEGGSHQQTSHALPQGTLFQLPQDKAATRVI